MRFAIPRIPVNRIPEDEFLDRFYRLEKPVIITCIEPPTDDVIHSLMARTGSQPGLGFAGSPLTSASDKLVIPELARLPLMPFYYTDLKWQIRHARESLI